VNLNEGTGVADEDAPRIEGTCYSFFTELSYFNLPFTILSFIIAY